MPSPALAFSTTDTPPADELLAVDTGSNNTTTPQRRSRSKQLAPFDDEAERRWWRGRKNLGKCCELLHSGYPELRSHGVGSRLLQEFEPTLEHELQHVLPHNSELPGAGVLSQARYAVLAQIAGYPNVSSSS